MRRPVFLLIAAIMLSVFAGGICAQDSPRNPPMVDQRRDAEKENYFALFNNLKRVSSSDSQRRAYEAAIEYLKRFEGENDPDARTVRKFVTEYEKPARESEIFNTYNSKNYPKTFELGRAMLKHDAENFFVLAVLTEAGLDNAQVGNASLNEATVDSAKKAIQLLEAGRVTRVAPFKNIEVARGYLNAAVGALLRDKSPAEAAQAFRKAVQSDSFYRNDPLTYHRLGIAILKGEFAQLSSEYNEKYGAQLASSAQQAMLKRLNTLVEQAIDAYARAVALSDPARLETKPETATAKSDYATGKPDGSATAVPFPPGLSTKILEQLTALYKGFHNNSDAGLNELISTVLSKPLP